jgi:TonB family protein
VKNAQHRPHQSLIVTTISVLLFGAAGVCAQTTPDTGSLPPATASATPTVAMPPSGAAPKPIEADAQQKRMERARALAAAHQLTAAAMELESIRASTRDEMLRNVSSLMLMGIYLEEGNYARAQAMLEETFTQRLASNESSVRTYFALAGQAVNGARSHVGRYRIFGINVASSGLPAEAVSDLDRLCLLLERMTAQAKALLAQNVKDNDAFALLEDISGIRATLARDNDDRIRWQNEYSAARARLATLNTEIASNGRPPSLSGDVDALSPQSARSPVAGAPATQPSAADGTAIGKLSSDDVNRGVRNAGNPTGTAASMPDVGSLIEKATKKVQPLYPQTAKTVGVSGLVRVKLVIDESGSVANIVWTEGPVLLRQAAQDAVKQWRFQPVMVGGKAVRAAGYIDFGFTR